MADAESGCALSNGRGAQLGQRPNIACARRDPKADRERHQRVVERVGEGTVTNKYVVTSSSVGGWHVRTCGTHTNTKGDWKQHA